MSPAICSVRGHIPSYCGHVGRGRPRGTPLIEVHFSQNEKRITRSGTRHLGASVLVASMVVLPGGPNDVIGHGIEKSPTYAAPSDGVARGAAVVVIEIVYGPA
ncbi:hypothetical protein EVAR_6421_1 [Eumeta japonica]|uniref:Uncharacterized protein n=1 Tax=Eumeta variegata TaxID=151549 RepID=A0A4C1TCQ4_EUMVA|nr:hypothetical protein EVAR_6421_1 [Eumeta japonica]